MTSLHIETRGRFRWLATVEDDADLTLRTARAVLPCGLVVERVDGAGAPILFVTDLTGCEVTLTMQQSTELAAALGELPDP